MDVQNILNDKAKKAKEKVAILCEWLLNNPAQVDDLLAFAGTAKDTVMANCLEALECATKSNPQIATPACIAFAAHALAENAPRVKWEAAKVIGNIAHRYPHDLNEAIRHLLENAEHEGTVVRWSVAFAIGAIIKINTPANINLIPAAEALCNREEKNSISKIYMEGLKKAKQ